MNRIIVKVIVETSDFPGQGKSVSASKNIDGLDLDDLESLSRRLIRAGIKSAALFDKYGWDQPEIVCSDTFMNDLEAGEIPTWKEVKLKYRLTSKSE